MQQSDRDIVATMFRGILNKRMHDDAATALANHIEDSCYSHANEAIAYSSRCGTIAACLDDDVVLTRILEGDAILNIGAMTERELRDNGLSKEELLIKTQTMQKIKIRTSGLIACPKCKAKECTYDERQRRSADEAATIECVCTLCGFKFIAR